MGEPIHQRLSPRHPETFPYRKSCVSEIHNHRTQPEPLSFSISFTFIIRSSVHELDWLLVVNLSCLPYTLRCHVHNFSAFSFASYDRSTDRSPSLTEYIRLQLGIPSAAISMTQHHRRYCLPFGGLQGAHRCQNCNTRQSLRP